MDFSVIPFTILKSQILAEIKTHAGMKKDNLVFVTEAGEQFFLVIEKCDIYGDLDKLIGSPIVQAEETHLYLSKYVYKLSTDNDSVFILCMGDTNFLKREKQ